MSKKLLIMNLVLAAIMSAPVAQAKEKPGIAQDSMAEETGATSRKNALSLELLGRGGLYSFNYDYSILKDLAIGAGAAFYSAAGASASVFPVYASQYFGGENHRFMVTGGPTLVLASASADSATLNGKGIAGTIGAGYEFRGDSGFLFRATPYFNFGALSGVWLGLSGGMTF
jgi:hypothetical protein